MTDTELRRIKMLDLIYDFRAPGPGMIPDMRDLFGDGIDHDEQILWLGTLRSLDGDGLIRLHSGIEFLGTSAQLLDDGRSDVERRRQRRVDPALRRAAAMKILLSWLYREGHEGDGWVQVGLILDTQEALFEGQKLGQVDIYRACERLLAEGLIDGDGKGVAELPGPAIARLTSLGQECVESGKEVSQFVRDHKRGNQATHITTNFHGAVTSSNVSWASEKVNQTVSQSGLAGDELLMLVKAIREALPMLGLTDQQAAEVGRDVEVVEYELAREEPDKGIVKTMLMRTVDTIVGAGNSALGMVLMGLAKEKLRDAGIPIE